MVRVNLETDRPPARRGGPGWLGFLDKKNNGLRVPRLEVVNYERSTPGADRIHYWRPTTQLRISLASINCDFWYCRQSFTSSRPVPTSSVLRGFRKMNCLLTDHCFVGLSITGLSFCGKLVCGFWIVDYWRIILKIVRKRKLQFFNRFEIGLWDFQLGESQKFCNGQQTVQF